MKFPLKASVLIVGLSLIISCWAVGNKQKLDVLPGGAEIGNLASESTADQQRLETGLVEALKLNKKTMERVGNSGRAIQAYMRNGIVNSKPNARADYTDYYLVKRLAKFMGHDLVLIEEEYMAAYIGCCVSPGAGVVVKIAGSTKNLEKFANENGCTVSDSVDLRGELERVDIKAKTLPGHYVSLSCRDRDIGAIAK